MQIDVVERRAVEADVVVNHVDLTVVPEPYIRHIARQEAIRGEYTERADDWPPLHFAIVQPPTDATPGLIRAIQTRYRLVERNVGEQDVHATALEHAGEREHVAQAAGEQRAAVPYRRSTNLHAWCACVPVTFCSRIAAISAASNASRVAKS